MYVVAFNGSPRKNGNTEISLKNVLESLKDNGWETELIQVGGKNIKGCLACNKCFEKRDGKCIQSKDIFNELMEKTERADAVIFGSPTYFADVTPELKALLDRAGYVAIANGRSLKGKIGAAVTVDANSGAIHAFDTINHMFLMSQMIVPGSISWNNGRGYEKGEVEKDEDGLSALKNLGEVINWLGKAIKPSMESFPSV